MTLNNNEFRTLEMNGLETITITKEALEKWKDHYDKKTAEWAAKMQDTDYDESKRFWFGFYTAKYDMICNILNMFAPAEE